MHGSFNDGQRSKHQAIRLSEALQSPVILFDWSSSKFSPAKVLSEGNFIRNQVEADRSEDDFRQFLDTLDASGQFRGGLILPGLDLMRRALARDTAALPLASGAHEIYPRNTDDAIISGCLEAQLGAIERAFARIVSEPEAICLLSGGAAQMLAPQLKIPHRLIDNLVLEGLAWQGLAQDS